MDFGSQLEIISGVEGGRLCNLAGMNDGQFTAKAAVLWGTIPKEARARFLEIMFCVKCCDSVTITNFTGKQPGVMFPNSARGLNSPGPRGRTGCHCLGPDR